MVKHSRGIILVYNINSESLVYTTTIKKWMFAKAENICEVLLFEVNEPTEGKKYYKNKL